MLAILSLATLPGCAEILDVYEFGVTPTVVECAEDEVAFGASCVTVGVDFELPECDAGEIVYPGLDACQPFDDACPESPDPVTYSSSYQGASFVWAQAAEGGDGSAATPFRTLSEAIAVAVAGDRIVVAPGTYHENIVIGLLPVDIEGVCARDVRLAPKSADEPAVLLTKTGGTKEQPTAGSRLARLHIETEGLGIRADTTTNLHLQDVRIDSGDSAVSLQVSRPITQQAVALDTATIERSLLGSSGASAIVATGYRLTIRQTRVARAGPAVDARGDFGVGVWVRPSRFATVTNSELKPFTGGLVVLEDTLIERSSYAGLRAQGSLVDMRRVVVRQVSASNMRDRLGWNDSGAGVVIEAEPWRLVDLPDDAVGVSTLEQVQIHDVVDAGIRALGVELSVMHSNIERVSPAPGSCAAHGIRTLGSPHIPAMLTLSRSLIEDVQQAAVHSLGASVVVQQSLLRRVEPCGSLADGVAVHAQPDPLLGQQASLPVQAAVVSSKLVGAERAAVVGFGDVRLCIRGTTTDEIETPWRAGIDPLYGEALATLAAVDSCAPDVGALQEAKLEAAILPRDELGTRLETVRGSGRLDDGTLQGIDNALVWLPGRDAVPPVATQPDTHAEPGSWTHPWLPAGQPFRLGFADLVGQRALGITTPFGATSVDELDEGIRPIPNARFVLRQGALALGEHLDLALGILSVTVLDAQLTNLPGATVELVEPKDVGDVLYVHIGSGTLSVLPPTGTTGAVAIVNLPPGQATVSVSVAEGGLTCTYTSTGGTVLGDASVANRATVHVLPAPPMQIYFVCE